jgi:hypothetical protein
MLWVPVERKLTMPHLALANRGCVIPCFKLDDLKTAARTTIPESAFSIL